MTDKEFNLLDEPWIRVIDSGCNVSEVSLTELFANAHSFKDLCGELPTQDFAVMRLLLAILHTVFSRFTSSGGSSPLKDPDDALDRWQELWENGKFPAEVISNYLETQRENFYLFHPERPFYQVAEIAKLEKIPNGEYDAQKFNGVLSKSAHKERLFPMLGGAKRLSVSYSQAARWLINLNAFDDNALKAGSGIGWLGELGLISVTGNNLFETLMFNLILFNTNSDEVWGYEKPVWENNAKAPLGKRQIVFPDNLSELYTLQSRRILLKRADNRVTGYKILGGDYFDKESSFCEPMTLWQLPSKSVYYVPKQHNPLTQFWREFYSILPNKNAKDRKCPGVISWFNVISEEIDKEFPLKIKIASLKYSGSQRSSIEKIFSDSLQMHASLISDMNVKWQTAVTNSVDFCDKISQKVWTFAKAVNLAAGGDYIPKEDKCSAKAFADRAKADFFDRIDAPFRKWLCALDPNTDDKLAKEKEWRHECVEIARRLGNEMIRQTDSAAIFGRKEHSAAQAMNKFIIELNAAENSDTKLK